MGKRSGPLSDEFINDSDEDEKPKAKKGKKAAAASDGAEGKWQEEDGGRYIKIKGLRRVTVSTFKKNVRVDIREFYEKDGEEKPGKKGISLSKEEWETLKGLMSEIDAEVARLDS